MFQNSMPFTASDVFGTDGVEITVTAIGLTKIAVTGTTITVGEISEGRR